MSARSRQRSAPHRDTINAHTSRKNASTCNVARTACQWTKRSSFADKSTSSYGTDAPTCREFHERGIHIESCKQSVDRSGYPQQKQHKIHPFPPCLEFARPVAWRLRSGTKNSAKITASTPTLNQTPNHTEAAASIANHTRSPIKSARFSS